MIGTILAIATSSCFCQLQGDALLDDLSYKAFRYFWEQSNVATGLTKDRAANLTTTDGYNVASIAATGYSLVAYAIGADRGWIGKSSARTRVRLTLQYLNTSGAKKNGWFYHFVNWQTGQRVWNSEVSSIDTAILIAGMLVAERYFADSQITASTNSILKAIDWHWMLTDGGAKPNSLTFCHGWTPESGFIPYRWDTYSEEMMLYVQAYGAYPALPLGCWAAVSKPMVTYGGYTVISGGPLFMHQMSHGFLDIKGIKQGSYDYWENSRQDTLASRQYCINNPKHYTGYGANFWGLSAGDTPDGYMALGAPGWGSDNGTIIPTSAIASVMFTPTESKAAADYIYSYRPAAYGRYGFSNGINPSRNWIDPDVIGIDLGMMLVGIANYKDNFVHKWSTAHPIIKSGILRMLLLTKKS
jgi:hypothetical protein